MKTNKNNKKNRLLIILSIGIGSFIFYYLFICILLNYVIGLKTGIKEYNVLDIAEKKSLVLFMRFKSHINKIKYPATSTMGKLPKNVSFVSGIEDTGSILRRYCLVIKHIEKYEKKFVELRNNDYADEVSLQMYRIHVNSNTNEYKLKKVKEVILKQHNLPLLERKRFNKIDIDLMKTKIEKHENDFQLELDILKGRIEKENKKIIAKINKYLKKSNMPEDMKDEILIVFNQEKCLKDVDELLSNLVNTFSLFAQKDKKWTKEYNFFKKLYNRCIKVDKEEEVISNNDRHETICLYNYLYYKKMHFDNLILTKENFIMSMPLFLMSRYLYLFILLLFSIIVVMISYGKNILRSSIYVILVIFIYYIFALMLFIYCNVVLEVTKIIIISIFSLMSVMGYKVFSTVKKNK